MPFEPGRLGQRPRRALRESTMGLSEREQGAGLPEKRKSANLSRASVRGQRGNLLVSATEKSFRDLSASHGTEQVRGPAGAGER